MTRPHRSGEGVCAGCGGCFHKDAPSRRLCRACRTPAKAQHTPTLDPLVQLGQNACQLMASLPVHSHHRAPLLSALSQHISSTTAATLLHVASSTIRNAKRKDHSSSDLLQQKYAAGVKRQKLSDERVEELCDFVAGACPTKSGERSVTYHQYTTDDSLYSAYFFLCDCPDTNKNDYHFVLHVWLLLFHFKKLLDHFDCIDVWSDGGPHHFKTRYCQWMWHWLSQTLFSQRRISHHFFASYHGHSLADGHAATIKRLIRTEYNMSQLQRFDTTTLALYWGPEDAAAVGRLIKKGVNTEICVIPKIDRDPHLKPDPQSLVHIKQQHCFDYEKGLCFRSERSVGTEKKRFSFELR